MAFITADRVKDTSITTGTGDITVSGGAPSGYRTFSTVLSVGDTFYYCVTGQASSEWEVGLGTYLSVNTFARTTVLASSASGSAVSFSSGTKNVFITLPANKTLQLDATASPISGAILYGTGSMLAYTAVGTSGQFLQSNGSAAPTWAPIGSVGTSISNGTSNVNIPSSNGAVTVATNGTTAITVDTSQNVTVANTVAMGSSFKRNILINGNFLVNQRTYVSGTATASGTYMHDRWKSTTTNSNYTFTQGTPDTTITIAAGTIAQIVEDKNVAGGVYTLSWTGTTTARIAINGGTTSGSYAASPITTSSATAGQTITVEFSTGTLGKVQLEPGTIATPYERQIYSDQLAQCQRYYNVYAWSSTGWGISTTQAQGGITFPVMRTSPTISDGGSNSITYGPGGSLGGSVSFSSIAATRSYLTFTASGGQTTNYPCIMLGIANMTAEL